MDEKERFKEEFYKTINDFLKAYPDKKEQEFEIIGKVINIFLHSVQLDTERLSFVEFYKKYLKHTLFLGNVDFTNTEVEQIIAESKLNERDKHLATLYWVDMMSEADIVDELGIDRKTVRNNIPKISLELKKVAAKMYSK